MTWWVEGNSKSQDNCCLDLEGIPKMLVLTMQVEYMINRKQLSRVMRIPGSIATHMYRKGKSQRHQVNAMNKTEYILFKDWGSKIQQDMLIVSVPFC